MRHFPRPSVVARFWPPPSGTLLTHSRKGGPMKNIRGWRPVDWVTALILIAPASCSAPLPTSANEEVLGESRAALATSANEAILGFESPDAWAVVQGVTPPPGTSPEHTEGASSLVLTPSGYVVVTSQPLPILSALT